MSAAGQQSRRRGGRAEPGGGTHRQGTALGRNVAAPRPAACGHAAAQDVQIGAIPAGAALVSTAQQTERYLSG